MRALVSICAVAICFAMVGCGGEAQEEVAETPAAEEIDHSGHDHAAPAEEAITLAGTTGCGHCNYHVTESCAAAMQTAAGDIFVIDDVDEADALWAARMEGKPVTVVGSVSDVDGVQHVTMQSYELGGE